MMLNSSVVLQEKVSNDLQLFKREFAQMKANLSQQILSYEKANQGIVNKSNFTLKYINYLTLKLFLDISCNYKLIL